MNEVPGSIPMAAISHSIKSSLSLTGCFPFLGPVGEQEVSPEKQCMTQTGRQHWVWFGLVALWHPESQIAFHASYADTKTMEGCVLVIVRALV